MYLTSWTPVLKEVNLSFYVRHQLHGTSVVMYGCTKTTNTINLIIKYNFNNLQVSPHPMQTKHLRSIRVTNCSAELFKMGNTNLIFLVEFQTHLCE